MNQSITQERMPNEITALRDQLQGMEGQFKAALPAHVPVERFMRVVMTALQNNPKLLNCERRSLWNACMKAAQDGLLPDGRLGAIVPYRDKNRGEIAQWMPMIAGVRQKVRNSGEIATWEAEVVHANDKFIYRKGDDPMILHEPVLTDPGPVIAAYSVATLRTGEKSREVMSVDEIEKVREVSRAKDSGPWISWYEEMCRKTVARRHSKVLPMSTDLDDLIRRDDDLYDLETAKEQARETKRQTLSGRLDVLAALPTSPEPLPNPPQEAPQAKADEPAPSDQGKQSGGAGERGTMQGTAELLDEIKMEMRKAAQRGTKQLAKEWASIHARYKPPLASEYERLRPIAEEADQQGELLP